MKNTAINIKLLAVAAIIIGVLVACTDYEGIISEKYENRLNAKLIECDNDIRGVTVNVNKVSYTCNGIQWKSDVTSSSMAEVASSSSASNIILDTVITSMSKQDAVKFVFNDIKNGVIEESIGLSKDAITAIKNGSVTEGNYQSKLDNADISVITMLVNAVIQTYTDTTITQREPPVDTAIYVPEIYECENGSFVLDKDDCDENTIIKSSK